MLSILSRVKSHYSRPGQIDMTYKGIRRNFTMYALKDLSFLHSCGRSGKNHYCMQGYAILIYQIKCTAEVLLYRTLRNWKASCNYY